MKTKNIILIVVLAVIAFGIGVFMMQHNMFFSTSSKQGQRDIWYCPMHPHYTSDHPGHCPICSMELVKKKIIAQQESTPKVPEKKILYWTDTMLPGYKSDHLGKSPMGMDLTPVYEKEPIEQESDVKGYTTVSVTAQKQQLIGLRTAVVELKPLVKLIRAFGTISSNAELYKIQNEFIDAYVAYVNVHRNYKQIRDTRDTWDIHRDLQTRLLEAQDKLLKLGLNEREIAQLQKVSWKEVWKQPKILLFNDTRRYWVMAQIFEQDYNFIKEGQEVEVSLPSYHEKIKGVIRSVGGFFDPTSRSVTALIELDDHTSQLAVNMQVDILIPVKIGNAILVPRESVMDTGLRKIVFVSKAGNTFEPREIQTGMETDDSFEVKSGLKEAECIVVSGNFLLDSESRVQAGLREDTATAKEGEAHGQ